MKKLILKLKEEKGISTVEVIVIIAILVAVALIFRTAIFGFIRNLTDSFFKVPDIT